MKSAISYLSYLPKQILLPFVLLTALLLPGVVFADHAPGSIPYEGDDTRGTDHAAFNLFSGTGIPNHTSDVGEQDFLTASEAGENDWTNSLEQCEGEIDLLVYVHNGAEVSANGENLDGEGVATGTRVRIALPDGSATTLNPEAFISADNTPTISDGVTITCGDHEIELDYVEGSAEIYRQFTSELESLSDNVVGPDGTLIGFETDDGVVPGCWEFRVFVKITVDIKKVEKPEPIIECTGLTATPAAVRPDEQVTFSATANAENAEVTSYEFDFGDNNSDIVTTSNESAQTEHSYDEAGTYTARVTVNFDVDGQERDDTNSKCVVKVSVEEEPEEPEEPPVTPPTEELPVTGPASVAAGFFGTSALFASARSWLASRRILRDGLLRK